MAAELGIDLIEFIFDYNDYEYNPLMSDAGLVVLGTGATDFERFFSALAKTDYSDPFIMQVYRDKEGIEIFQKQLDWIKPKLESWFLGKGRK